MEKVDRERATTVYAHKHCTELCNKRGCGTLFSIDGNWKLNYPICMYQAPKDVSGFDGKLNYISSCSNGPLPGKAFCLHHCTVVEKEGIPTGLREFLQFCGVSHKSTHDEASETDLTKIGKVTSGFHKDSSRTSAAECQGTGDFLRQQKRLSRAIDATDEDTQTQTACNKETGEKRCLQKWSRGIWVCVSGGGIIQTWQPLYQSEGPAQVFLLVLTWLTAAFGNLSRTDWQKIILSYDNMCHLDNLKVAKQPLPLPGDLKFIWRDVRKIIDTLHIRNHKDARCKAVYTPDLIKEEHPTYNTMSCEQTFVWLSRFKKVVCAMHKTHHHFYIHRMVKRRNTYIEYCYTNNRRPLQPKAKSSLVQ